MRRAARTQRRVLRVVGSAKLGPTVAEALPSLAAAGVTDVVVDVDWDGDVVTQATQLVDAAAR